MGQIKRTPFRGNIKYKIQNLIVGEIALENVPGHVHVYSYIYWECQRLSQSDFMEGYEASGEESVGGRGCGECKWAITRRNIY